LITSPGEHDGRAEDLIYAIKDFKQSRTDFGKNSSYADTIQLINAIKDFFNAKAAYIGQAFKGYDSITFKNTMGEDTKVFLGDLEYAPFVQKETQSDTLYSSIYGGKNYTTFGNDLNKAVDSTFASGNEFEYDAILKVLKAIFPFEATNLNTWNDAENWIDNNMGTDDLAWKVYSATGVIEDAQKVPGTYDKTKADLNLVGKIGGNQTPNLVATKFSLLFQIPNINNNQYGIIRLQTNPFDPGGGHCYWGTLLLVSGASPDDFLVEIVELPEHPWFLGCQFHPEFKSRPNRAHPLFVSFLEAAIKSRVKRA
jgi:hypothetical protein